MAVGQQTMPFSFKKDITSLAKSASRRGKDSSGILINNNAYAMNNLTVTVEALTDEFEECSVSSNALTMSTGTWGDDD